MSARMTVATIKQVVHSVTLALPMPHTRLTHRFCLAKTVECPGVEPGLTWYLGAANSREELGGPWENRTPDYSVQANCYPA